MFRVLVSALGVLALALSAAAQVTPFPGNFRTQEITTDDGATIYVRAGGQGPAVVLLHGFGDTGDMWAPLAAALARDHTVVVPDLRGMGLSSHPAAGYDKRTQAADVRAVLTRLGDHLFSQYTANREQTKEMTSRGSLNHVQNVHLETLAESAADGASSRGTF